MAGDVPESQRPLKLVEESQQPQALGLGLDGRCLLVSDAGCDEVLNSPEVAEDQERTVPGAGQLAGLVYDPFQDGAEVQFPGDAKGGLAQQGKAVAQLVYLLLHPGSFSQAEARPWDSLRFPSVGILARGICDWRIHGPGIISPGVQNLHETYTTINIKLIGSTHQLRRLYCVPIRGAPCRNAIRSEIASGSGRSERT